MNGVYSGQHDIRTHAYGGIGSHSGERGNKATELVPTPKERIHLSKVIAESSVYNDFSTSSKLHLRAWCVVQPTHNSMACEI